MKDAPKLDMQHIARFLDDDDLNYCESCGELLPSDLYAEDEIYCMDCE